MSAYSDDACAAAIAWAQSVVDEFCERSFALAADDTVQLNPQHPALLPDPPVASVSKVEAFMAPCGGTLSWVDITATTETTPDGYVYDLVGQPGYPWQGGPTWPSLPQSLRVTYTHGFAEVPAAVKAATVKLAAGYLPNPEAYIEKRIGDNTFRWLNAVLGETIVGLGGYRLAGIA